MALTDRVTISWDAGPKGRAGQGGKASTGSSSAKLTTGNISLQDAHLVDWVTAIGPLSQAVVTRAGFDHSSDYAPGLPVAPLNKGEKWVVTMKENSGNMRTFTHTIPAADKSGGHVAANTLNWDPTDTDWAAYILAANQLLTTPDGNAMICHFATLLTRRR